jgi:plasmid maintenance system antidote protein VapI
MPEIKKAENSKKEKEVAKPKAVKSRKKPGPRGPRKIKEPKSAESIHIGQIIARKMKSRGLTKNKLSKILKVTPPTVSLMVNSHSVQTDRLLAISKVLKHNFFAEIAQKLNIGETEKTHAESVSDPRVNNLQGKIADLETELRFLREEKVYLRHIIELLSGQGKK